jgi:predicted MPP superfamily phosphohydrolase
MKGRKITFKKSWIILLALIAFAILCFIYAHFEYTNIKIKEFTLESSKIKGDGFRVMFITDFQFDTKAGLNIKALQNVIDTANQQEADLLLIGGDFVNYRRYQDDFYEIFKTLKIPKLGAYAILGNHDYYSFDDNIEQLESMGIKVLINDSVGIFTETDHIEILGVEDLWFGEPDFKSAIPPEPYLSGGSITYNNDDDPETLIEEHISEPFVFFLTHNPDYFLDELTSDQRQQLDFVLSGHAHAGQVTFFGLFGMAPISRKNLVKYRYGLRQLDEVPIYISSGLGGSAFGYYIRFFARPEIVIINVKKSV